MAGPSFPVNSPQWVHYIFVNLKFSLIIDILISIDFFITLITSAMVTTFAVN
jgi:hypothetical protein